MITEPLRNYTISSKKCEHRNELKVRKRLTYDNRWQVGWFCEQCNKFVKKGKGMWLAQDNLYLPGIIAVEP